MSWQPDSKSAISCRMYVVSSILLANNQHMSQWFIAFCNHLALHEKHGSIILLNSLNCWRHGRQFCFARRCQRDNSSRQPRGPTGKRIDVLRPESAAGFGVAVQVCRGFCRIHTAEIDNHFVAGGAVAAAGDGRHTGPGGRAGCGDGNAGRHSGKDNGSSRKIGALPGERAAARHYSVSFAP